MSNIQKFKEQYSNDNALEKELSKIDEIEVSNIKKINFRQKVIEKYCIEPEWFRIENWYCDDTFVDELIVGYGVGSALSDDSDFERENKIEKWGE